MGELVDAISLSRGGARGQGIVEYGLAIGGLVLVAAVVLVFFGDAVSAGLDFIGNLIDAATR